MHDYEPTFLDCIAVGVAAFLGSICLAGAFIGAGWLAGLW